MSKVQAIARVKDSCDVCGRDVHRKDLVRTQVRFLNAHGSNYFLTSSYNSSYWNCNATDKGNLACGPTDGGRVKVSFDNTVTEALGAQTWSGTGKVMRSTSAVDASTWTTFVVSAEVGPWFTWSAGDSEFDGGHEAQTAELSITMGLCDSDGNNKTSERTWTGLRTQQRVWCSVTVADIASPLSSSAVYVYWTVTVTGSGYWYIDSMQIEKNATSPGTFKPTAGAAVDITDTKSMAVRKVCPNCWEPLLKESEQYGKPRTEVEPSIPSEMQEV